MLSLQALEDVLRVPQRRRFHKGFARIPMASLATKVYAAFVPLSLGNLVGKLFWITVVPRGVLMWIYARTPMVTLVAHPQEELRLKLPASKNPNHIGDSRGYEGPSRRRKGVMEESETSQFQCKNSWEKIQNQDLILLLRMLNLLGHHISELKVVFL